MRLLLIFWVSLLCSCKTPSASNNTPKASPELEKLKQHALSTLVFVKGGTFLMGDAGYIDKDGQQRFWSAGDDNKITRNVTLSSYSIQKYETTFEQMDSWTYAIGKELIYGYLRSHPANKAPKPAKGMTWYEARDYCLFLGGLTGLPFDLPTEAQWEFAARSRGLNVPYATDNGKREKGRNVLDPMKYELAVTDPPGTYPPNPLGLYDMTGNVSEWTLDWHMSRYPFEDEIDPTGPNDEQVKKNYLTSKVARGFGLAGGDASVLFSRLDTEPDNNGAGTGVRCVVNSTHPIAP